MVDGTGAQPPVNEVVLSVAMVPQPTLIGPRIPEIFGPWYVEHQNVQVVQPYMMPIEQDPAIGPAVPPGATLNFTSVIESRYWLNSADGAEVVQVQPDYLALNWKRTAPDQEYPHFAALRERFASLTTSASEGLQKFGGTVGPVRAELAYINLIEPNSLWGNLSEVHRILNVSSGLVEDYEQFSFATSLPIRDERDFHGRLHVTIQPSFDWLKAEPRIHLNITARSLNFPTSSCERAFSFFDRAHTVANRAFRNILTAEAREIWGVDEHSHGADLGVDRVWTPLP
ncbi:TIGR04255 family protein [Streptomyces xanthochromogenes]|uniref:TIGR04255 family protein n=1 Tax=Streptomyces xanthochromogenes TaxID=67384 RepID=UPI002F3E79F9